MKLFFVFPISGPNNGVKIISNHIIKKINKTGVDTELIDTAQASEFSDFGKFRISKVIHALKLVLRILRIPRKSYVYMNFTAKGLAYHRDFFLIFFSKILSHKITIHIHEMGHEKKSSLFLKILLKNINVIVINKRQLNNLRYLNNIYLLDNSLPDQNPEEFKKKERKILYFSNLSKLKGIDLLCDFCELLLASNTKTSCKLTICGGILDRYTEQKLDYIINKYSFVEYLGPIENENEKKKIFQEHSILLFTSKENHEVYPLVYIEALMFGLGIVTTEQVVAEKVLRYGNGFVIDQIKKGILGKLNKILTNNTFEKSRKLYIEDYSFDNYVFKISNIIFKKK